LPPLPPLRTGRETFASSGSSRTKAPRERSRLSRRFHPGWRAGGAILLLERTFHEVGLTLWVKRIGLPPDFDMTPYFGFARIHEAQPNGFAVRGLLLRLARKRPSSLAQGWCFAPKKRNAGNGNNGQPTQAVQPTLSSWTRRAGSGSTSSNGRRADRKPAAA
jgi:hypothetical protein